MSANPNFELESRAVYKALTRMTTDFALQQTSFTYWKMDFSDTSLNPVDFATALQSHVGLDGQDKTSLMIALYSALTHSLDALSPVPTSINSITEVEAATAPSAHEEKAASKSFVTPNTPHWTMIVEFMKHIVAEVKKEGQESIIEFNEILVEQQVNLDRDLFNPLVQWVESSFSKLDIDTNISETACSQYSHHLYLILCEVLGPPKADKILDTTIRRLYEMPEQAYFNAKNLL